MRPMGWRRIVVSVMVCATVCAADVTIYRIGGQQLPPPAELGQPGVRFQQLDWRNGSAEAWRLQITDAGVAPRWTNPLTTLPLNGSNDHQLRPLFDRNFLSCGYCATLTAAGYLCGVCRGVYPEQGAINFRLPDRLFVERVRIRSGGADGLGVLRDFALHLSQEFLQPSSGPRTPFTVEIQDNELIDLEVGGLSTETRTATVQLALAEHENPVVLQEVMIYAGGAATQASFTSPVIDYRRPAVWGELRWALDAQPGSRVSLTGRSGDRAQSLVYWRYTGVGDQKVRVTQSEYDALRSSEKAGASYDYDSWTAWPPSFDLQGNGDPPLPARPRRALQLRLEFDTAGNDPSRIAFVEFRGSDPAAGQVVGELAPFQVEAGVDTEFRYTLKPTFGPLDKGFNQLELRAVAARLDSVLDFSVDDVPTPYRLHALSPDRLLVSFQRVDEAQTDALVELRFRAQALRYGASFAAFLRDSDRPFDVPQPVLPGDALDEVASDRVWIETTVRVGSVLQVSASPAALSPNGDGINDEVRIRYDLFETTGEVGVTVDISDVAGRRVRQLHEGPAQIGRFEHAWDGRDDGGRIVPPGIYLYRVTAGVRGSDAWVGLLHVVY